MKKSLSFISLAGILAISSASAATTLFSDQFASDTTASYSIVSTGTPGIAWSATAGVGGGGGLVITNAGNPSTSLIPDTAGSNTPYTVGVGASNSITMSMKLRYSGSQGGTSQGFLGLSNGQDYIWGGNTIGATTALGGAIVNGINLVNRGGTNGGVGNSSALGGPNASLVSGNWYLYQVTMTKPTAGNNTWGLDGFLQDLGSTGTTPGANIFSYTGSTNTFGSIANSGINAAATQTFVNFGVRSQMWTAADDFVVTAIPEPSSALLGAFGLLGLLGYRKRSNG